jgi:hypothetical protein
MLLASSDLRAIGAARRRPRWQIVSLVQLLTALLALMAVLVVGSTGAARLRLLRDDLQYGSPRTTQLDGFLGHQENRGVPTHLIAMNLHRHVVLIEFPGGDASAPKVQVGPYLFGAQSENTPVRMDLQDMDGDGALDVVLDIDDEWLVYLNKDGGLRLPTDAEQRRIAPPAGQEGGGYGLR